MTVSRAHREQSVRIEEAEIKPHRRNRYCGMHILRSDSRHWFAPCSPFQEVNGSGWIRLKTGKWYCNLRSMTSQLLVRQLGKCVTRGS